MSVGRLKETLWIEGTIVLAHFKMQMSTGGAPAGTHLADHLATAHQAAQPGQATRHVGIACGDLLTMIDLDQVTVLMVHFRTHHHTTGGGLDRRADGRGKIHPLMQCLAAGEWINAKAEIGAPVCRNGQ